MSKLLERVRLRCIECADCLVWQGSSAHGKHPQVRIKGRSISLRKALWEEEHGRPLPAGYEVAVTCETRNCIAHYKAMTHKQIAKRTAATGVYANPVRKAKISATKQAQSAALTREQVMDIRYGGGTLQEAADRHGISRARAGQLRRGDRWKDYSNPFTGLLAANDSQRARA